MQFINRNDVTNTVFNSSSILFQRGTLALYKHTDAVPLWALGLKKDKKDSVALYILELYKTTTLHSVLPLLDVHPNILV